MIAALAVAALKYMQALSSKTHTDLPAPTRGFWSRTVLKTRLMLAHPLGPTHFWNGFCGGMTVLDALLASTWITMTVLYLYYEIMRAFAFSAARMPGPDSLPPVSSPPDMTTPNPLRNHAMNPPAGVCVS